MQTDLDPQKPPENLADRRRHPRYRFSIPLNIHSADGTSIPGISIEISESGLSAITADPLKVDDIVTLEPIAGRVSARVRRHIGRVYGFEFLNVTSEQTERIRESCKMLPRYLGGSLNI